jgi:RNA polymerase sigma-70 factor (ECF subfamily)
VEDSPESRPESHVQSLYRFALRLTGDRDAAHDLTQEAFLRAWRARKRLREPRAARVWILRIAQNLWRDHLRRKRRREPVEGLPGEELEPAIAAGDQDRLGHEEEVAIVIQAMDALPARQSQVLHLSAFEGLGYREIAEVLEISEGAVKASLSLARKALRAKLDRVRPGGWGC